MWQGHCAGSICTRQRYLGALPGHEVVFLTQRTDATFPGVRKIVSRPHRAVTPAIPMTCGKPMRECCMLRRSRVALALKQSGFVPEGMLGRNGWGEIGYLKEMFPPTTPLLSDFEFFRHLQGAVEVGFDPTAVTAFDAGPRLRTKNLGHPLGLEVADAGQCPTRWQQTRTPAPISPACMWCTRAWTRRGRCRILGWCTRSIKPLGPKPHVCGHSLGAAHASSYLNNK